MHQGTVSRFVKKLGGRDACKCRTRLKMFKNSKNGVVSFFILQDFFAIEKSWRIRSCRANNLWSNPAAEDLKVWYRFLEQAKFFLYYRNPEIKSTEPNNLGALCSPCSGQDLKSTIKLLLEELISLIVYILPLPATNRSLVQILFARFSSGSRKKILY